MLIQGKKTILSLILICFSFVLVSSQPAAALTCQNLFKSVGQKGPADFLELDYLQAADHIVPWALRSFEMKLRQLRRGGYSQKEAKALRKHILELRFYLEIFAPAYVKTSQKDAWLEAWKILKRGYSLIGSYKSARKNKPSKQEKKMAQIQEWVDSQLNGNIANILLNLQGQKASTITLRELPDSIHWKADFLKPQSGQRGKDVFVDLTLKLLNDARFELPEFLKTRNLVSHREAESFHDFRKQLRAAVKLAGVLKINVEKDYQQLFTLLYAIGKINDQIESFQILQKKSAAAYELGQKQYEVEQMWNTVKRRWSSSDVEKQILLLTDRLQSLSQ